MTRRQATTPCRWWNQAEHPRQTGADCIQYRGVVAHKLFLPASFLRPFFYIMHSEAVVLVHQSFSFKVVNGARRAVREAVESLCGIRTRSLPPGVPPLLPSSFRLSELPRISVRTGGISAAVGRTRVPGSRGFRGLDTSCRDQAAGGDLPEKGTPG